MKQQQVEIRDEDHVIQTVMTMIGILQDFSPTQQLMLIEIVVGVINVKNSPRENRGSSKEAGLRDAHDRFHEAFGFCPFSTKPQEREE